VIQTATINVTVELVRPFIKVRSSGDFAGDLTLFSAVCWCGRKAKVVVR